MALNPVTSPLSNWVLLKPAIINTGARYSLNNKAGIPS